MAEQFTTDVRNATEIRTADSAVAAASWTMELSDDERIEYALQDHALLRTAYRADKVVGREAFALGGDRTARLELHPAKQPNKATLILERVADGAAPAIANMRIEVPIGWVRRFAATGKIPKADRAIQ